MRIPLDRQSSKALYRQIEGFLKEEILSGVLQVDTKLPSTRELASSLGVNRITVSNAYAELEAAGLVYSRLGSGTYVAPVFQYAGWSEKIRHPDRDWPMWQKNILTKSRLPMQDKMAEYQRTNVLPGDVINFSGGLGSDEFFPTEDIRKALQVVLRRDMHEAVGYGERAGYLPLRVTISQILASQGILTSPEEILITSGSHQALALVSSLLLKPGDVVLVENPTYATAVDLFVSLGAQVVGVPVDEYGMRVELVEDHLRTYHPGLIYTIPNFQNPTGACLTGDRRRQLMNLAVSYNIPILEDDYVGDLRYEGQAQPALKAIDPGGYVIHCGTFSKMVMPGLRLGYLVISGPVYSQIVHWKRIHDLAASSLIQRALNEYISVGRYEANLRRSRRVYRRHRDAILAGLNREMPDGSVWQVPQGGLFVWLKLPDGISVRELYPIALQEKVEFAPGALFFLDDKENSYIRLNFAMPPLEKIEEGVSRLGRAITLCAT